MKTIRQRGARARGFSLIEVLVALFVLSVGLLGLAQLHAKGLRFTQDARNVGLAANLASDMAERIRANSEGALEGHYDGITGSETDPGCTVCTPAQRAQADAAQWSARLSATLGETASGSVAAAASGRHTITVTWNATLGASLARGAQSYDLVVQP